MRTPLFYAIVCMVLALVLYSIAVWSENHSRQLKGWHLILFWCGFIFDTTGTWIMIGIAGEQGLNLHTITGTSAIALMFIHSVWASIVLLLKNKKWITIFHRYSIGVWILWVAAFVSELAGAMFGLL